MIFLTVSDTFTFKTQVSAFGYMITVTYSYMLFKILFCGNNCIHTHV